MCLHHKTKSRSGVAICSLFQNDVNPLTQRRKDGRGQQEPHCEKQFLQRDPARKKTQKPQTLAAKCVKLYTSVGFRSLWFFIFITNLSVQFTFPLEGWTDEHQRGVDLRLRGASVAASLRHAVVSAQHQQVGQRSVRLLRAANAKVNGLGFPRGQCTKLRSVWIIHARLQMNKE